MQDTDNTKEQLLNEMKQLHQRLAELEEINFQGEPKNIGQNALNSKNLYLDNSEYSINDLVDLELLRKIFESFSSATSFTVGFVSHPSQEILIATGWRDICKKFHRAFPESAKRCKESNVHLTEQLKGLKQLSIETCKHGLVDGATPIIVRGRHLATLATGQALFEKPDVERFKKQAEIYGYDIDDYLAALSKVPVVTKGQFRKMLSFLADVAVMITELGLINLEHKKASRALGKKVIEHLQAEEELQRALDDLERKRKNLEEMNTTLKVILAQLDKAKVELQESILANVRHLIFPCLENLRKTPLSQEQGRYFDMLASSIHNIVSPFVQKLSHTYLSLTPTEIRVAEMIRDGMQTKEIAAVLNLSPTTVRSYRENIRHKLRLQGKKTNLRSFLQTMK